MAYSDLFVQSLNDAIQALTTEREGLIKRIAVLEKICEDYEKELHELQKGY